MDTSEQYIKMCEKAEEIQKVFDRSGLLFLGAPTDFNGIILQIRSHDVLMNGIWLPRQDQLQKMMGDFTQCLQTLTLWCCKSLPKTSDVESMEQLWLAFVMKEKYGKIWNGEDWEEVQTEKAERCDKLIELIKKS